MDAIAKPEILDFSWQLFSGQMRRRECVRAPAYRVHPTPTSHTCMR